MTRYQNPIALKLPLNLPAPLAIPFGVTPREFFSELPVTIITSRAAAESNSTVGSSFPEEEEEDHCLLNLGFYGICAMFNLKT